MIEPRYRKHMTAEMLVYIEHMNELTKSEVALCQYEIEKLQVLLIETDQTKLSTSGLPIVNGSINQMRELKRYWEQRLRAMKALESQ